jgi:hypothetical protein
MMETFITIFIGVLIAVSLIGPLATEVNSSSNASSSLALVSPWGATVLRLVPGFYALMALLLVVAGLYVIMKRAGMG